MQMCLVANGDGKALLWWKYAFCFWQYGLNISSWNQLRTARGPLGFPEGRQRGTLTEALAFAPASLTDAHTQSMTRR